MLSDRYTRPTLLLSKFDEKSAAPLIYQSLALVRVIFVVCLSFIKEDLSADRESFDVSEMHFVIIVFVSSKTFGQETLVYFCCQEKFSRQSLKISVSQTERKHPVTLFRCVLGNRVGQFCKKKATNCNHSVLAGQKYQKKMPLKTATCPCFVRSWGVQKW